jgi:hypothetical protein
MGVRAFRRRVGALVVAAALLGGCANTAGVAEFQVYALSVDTLAAASEPVIARLRVEERRSAVRRIDGGRVTADGLGSFTVNGADAGAPVLGLAPEFRVAHASYFAESGDPPLAAAVRLSVEALRRFSAAMTVYAEGRGLDDAIGDLAGVAGDVRAGLSAFGAAVPAADTALAGAREAAQFADAVGSRAAFRRILREEGANVDALFAQLIENAPVVFDTITEPDRVARELEADARQAEALRARIVADRALVAEWTMMLVETRAQFAATLAAIDAPGSAGASIASAAAASADLRVRLDRIRAIEAAR